MKICQTKTLALLTIVLCFNFFLAQAQKDSLNPNNIEIDHSLIKIESYKMKWSMLQGDSKIEIGNVLTTINKNEERIVIYTEVKINQEPIKWIDITVVEATTYKPIYHISNNKSRDMVLRFEETISGYYLNNQTEERSKILENAAGAYFDSNFYPHLLRWLPFQEGYSTVISIFDYNPDKKTGVLTATIKNASEDMIVINGKEREIWKVVATDDISNNTALSTYYIDRTSRELLKQEIEMAGRKMVMEIIE